MKPTKTHKKNMPDESKSGSSIHNYFKTAPKETVVCAPSNVKSVYRHALLDKLKRFDDEGTSNNENSESGRENGAIASTSELVTNHIERNKSNRRDPHQASDRVDSECSACEKWRNKYKEMEKSYLKVCVSHTELMMKYKDLVLVSTGIIRPNIETEQIDEVNNSGSVPLCPNTVRPNNESEVSPTLSVADIVFTAHELKCLQCIPLDKTKDSTFILNCIQYAYKGNAACLTSKTLKGTRGRFEVRDDEVVTIKPRKDPLTPEKVVRIQQLFIDRVTKSKCMASEYGERVTQINFNKLIANAVKNVSNKEALTKVKSNQNADLNL